MQRGDAGRGGLYGDQEGADTWQKKQHFSGALKRDTSARIIPDKAAQDRKMKELYGDKAVLAGKKGDGSLMSSAADWRNPHQTYTNKYEKTGNVTGGAVVDRKERKAKELGSNVLTHADSALHDERTNNYDKSNKRIDMASNAGWNAQNGLAKPNNSVKQDAF